MVPSHAFVIRFAVAAVLQWHSQQLSLRIQLLRCKLLPRLAHLNREHSGFSHMLPRLAHLNREPSGFRRMLPRLAHLNRQHSGFSRMLEPRAL